MEGKDGPLDTLNGAQAISVKFTLPPSIRVTAQDRSPNVRHRSLKASNVYVAAPWASGTAAIGVPPTEIHCIAALDPMNCGLGAGVAPTAEQ